MKTTLLSVLVALLSFSASAEVARSYVMERHAVNLKPGDHFVVTAKANFVKLDRSKMRKEKIGTTARETATEESIVEGVPAATEMTWDFVVPESGEVQAEPVSFDFDRPLVGNAGETRAILVKIFVTKMTEGEPWKRGNVFAVPVTQEPPRSECFGLRGTADGGLAVSLRPDCP